MKKYLCKSVFFALALFIISLSSTSCGVLGKLVFKQNNNNEAKQINEELISATKAVISSQWYSDYGESVKIEPNFLSFDFAHDESKHLYTTFGTVSVYYEGYTYAADYTIKFQKKTETKGFTKDSADISVFYSVDNNGNLKVYNYLIDGHQYGTVYDNYGIGLFSFNNNYAELIMYTSSGILAHTSGGSYNMIKTPTSYYISVKSSKTNTTTLLRYNDQLDYIDFNGDIFVRYDQY